MDGGDGVGGTEESKCRKGTVPEVKQTETREEQKKRRRKKERGKKSERKCQLRKWRTK